MKAKRKRTFEARLAATNAKTGVALSAFEQAVVDLETVAAEQEALAAELSSEITRLVNVRREARTGSIAAMESAEKIRGLLP